MINKVDRPDARIEEVVNQVEELFLDLDADEDQVGFPILYSNARAGWASTERDVRGTDLRPLFAAVLEHFLGMYVSMNSFSQLRVRTKQRKEVMRQWQPRAGRKILM